ncbi:MAG: hypothetical protein ACOYOK_06950 [Pseudobdellovibrionaceae bacterium]
MNKFMNIQKLFLLISFFWSSSLLAMSLDWKGGYRFEWTEIEKPQLGYTGAPGGSKSYILQSLYLSPKVIAADGVNIISRFEILPNTQTAYANSQAGQIWGLGTQSSDPSLNNAKSDNQGQTQIRVSQAYLNINQEYGSLILGRAPFEFGLGMTYNAGNGAFDHWMDNRDIATYKFIVGDWTFAPMISRIYDVDVQRGEAMQEQSFILNYESKDTGSVIGYMQSSRKAPQSINDAKTAFGGASVNGDFNLNRTNFTLGRTWSNFAFKFEAGFETGSTGIVNSSGQNIDMNGYGLALELTVPKGKSKWDYVFKVGMATGDNPDTATYEGYQFDRNYDVAMLLFNHRLGAKHRDFLRTSLIRSTSVDHATSIDDEAISNAIYVSPQFNYEWNDKLDLKNTITYAQLVVEPNTVSSNIRNTQKDLGFEWDIELAYKPQEKIQWVNQIGLLFPGKAFENGSENLSTDFTYGFASKAVISF